MARQTKVQKVLTEEEWSDVLQAKARAAGAAGLTAAKLSRPRSEAQAAASTVALDSAIESGRLVRVTRGVKQKFYASEFAPPSPEQQFMRGVMEKVTPGVAWLEDVLTGKDKDAGQKRQWLERLVRVGNLAQISVVTSARAKKRAIIKGTKETAFPEWSQIEHTARTIAAERFDGTVSFEALAEHLGVTPLVVKTAVTQQMTLRGGLQLVRGEAREVADPTTAGLQSGGDIYYRFRFLE